MAERNVPIGPAAGSTKRVPGIVRALRHRNYRLFFGGQTISLIGSFLTNTATWWLALTLVHDKIQQAEVLGVVGFASQIPLFFLAPVAGVWVDRLNRKKLLIVTQCLAMLQSFALAALALSHRITITQVIALAVFQGLINAFDIPGRQTFLNDMVTDREDLANAIALNSTMVHSARLIGPALAGLLIWVLSIGWCFLLDGISYLAVIAALVAMVITPRAPRPRHSVWEDLREGLNYVFRSPPMCLLLFLMVTFSLTAVPALTVLMPIFGEHFGGDQHGAQVFGFLAAASGFGALIGAISLAARKTVLGLGRLIAISSTVYGLAVAAFALSHSLWLSLLIMPFTGWGMITVFASTNTILQTLADDHMRGRVMSLFSMSFVGMMPFGVLAAGRLASHLSRGGDSITGAARTLLIGSALCLVAAGIYAFLLPSVRKHIRPIYIQRGILPAVATSLQVASAAAQAGEG